MGEIECNGAKKTRARVPAPVKSCVDAPFNASNLALIWGVRSGALMCPASECSGFSAGPYGFAQIGSISSSRPLCAVI